jgi:tetratricopeptide (TPR) repeat protein
LRVLYHRSQRFLQEKKIVIAYFSEEEYGISGYLDFLIRILNAFIRWNDDDRDFLNQQMDLLRNTHPNRQIDVAESIIKNYVGDKPLLILAENFDDILAALGKNGQGKLRAFLYTHNHTSIIATSQALSPDLGEEDLPFYNFFTLIYLKKITYEDSMNLIRRLAEIEKQENVIEHLKVKGKAQVRAVHELVKGNHRLLVTFYEFLKADTLASLSQIFIKTLNDLKPYYETFIRYLPPQQQKILHYLALAKSVQNGTEISKNCFIDPKSLSKQLSELNRRNLIDIIPDPEDKRNKVYEISEPLLRISIEIGEHKEGISALFIDFLALYYSFDELHHQKRRFSNLLEGETDPHRKQDLYYEVVARDKAIALKKQLEENKKPSKALKEMYEAYISADYKEVIQLAEKVDEQERDDLYYFSLGVAFGVINKIEKAISTFQKAIEMKPNDHDSWNNLGIAYGNQGEIEKAINSYQKAIEIKPDFHESWNNLGNAYGSKGEIEKEMLSYQKAIEIKPDYDTAWNNLGVAYINQGKIEKAITVYQKAIEIKPNFHKAWYNLGVAYQNQGEIEKAIEAYQKAIEIKPDYHEAWYNLGNAYANQGEIENAIEAYQKAILTGYNAKNNSRFIGQSGFEKLADAISYVLKNGKKLKKQALSSLEEVIEEVYGLPDELKTPYQYIKTYRRYVLEEEEKAILELPKEQRAFFMQEILGKK